MIRRHAPIILTLVLGIILSITAFLFIQESEHDRWRGGFKRAADERLIVLERDFFSTFETLQSLGGLFNAAPGLDREAFRRFTAPVLARHPGIQALEWIPRVKASERPAYEAAARRDGFPGFKFTERQAQGRMAGAAERDEYFPVYFVEPLKGNELALGFDLGSNPVRLKALQQARDSGEMVATARITLVQETGAQYGFLVFKPVYGEGPAPDTVKSRRQNLAGFALGVFRIGDIIEGSMGRLGSGSKAMDVFILDRSAPVGKQLLYPKPAGERSREELLASDCVASQRNVAGRRWSVSFCPPGGRHQVAYYRQSVAVLLAGLLLSGLLAAYLRMIITQRERTERVVEQRTAELAESESRVRAVVDNVIDGIITINADGAIRTFNPAAESIFGYSADEVAGQNVKILMPPPYKDEHDGYLANYINTGNAKIIGIGREVEGRRKDGSTFPMSLAVSEIELGDKRMFVGVVRDITRFKQAEDALHAAKEQAENANRVKSDFLAMMSHEIRTPINGILGVLGLLKDTDLDGEQHNYVDTGHNSAEALLDIINDILDFSKIEAGKLEFEIVEFDLASLAEGVAEMLSPRASAKNIGLSLNIAEDAPNRLMGDPGRVRQILLNLAGNAVKFTLEGEVTISVSAVDETPSRTTLRFEVADTGIGIPEEKHDGLFAEFTTVDPSYSRKFEGTGLGLAISKRLVGMMGGEIGFTSAQRKGSTFWFTVGFEKASGESAGPAPPKAAGAVSLAGRKLRILLAEDNPTNRLVIKAILRKAGQHVDAVANGMEAVEAVRTLPYDIVLMDVSMPDMDGLEATAAIRSMGEGKADIPIIALTAHAMKGDREKFIAAGMNDYLQKPANRDQILGMLAKWAGGGMDHPIAGADDSRADKNGGAKQVLDESLLVELAEATSPEVVPGLIKSFLGHLDERLERIATAVVKTDMDALELETHTLGSSAATFGAMQLHHLCRAIEAACNGKDHERALDLSATFAEVAGKASKALSEYLEGLS